MLHAKLYPLVQELQCALLSHPPPTPATFSSYQQFHQVIKSACCLGSTCSTFCFWRCFSSLQQNGRVKNISHPYSCSVWSLVKRIWCSKVSNYLPWMEKLWQLSNRAEYTKQHWMEHSSFDTLLMVQQYTPSSQEITPFTEVSYAVRVRLQCILKVVFCFYFILFLQADHITFR